MNKASKITLWVLGTIVAVLVAAFLAADIIVSKLVQREVSVALKKMPQAEASVGNIYLHLLSGSAIVKDITFRTHHLNLEEDSLSSDSIVPGLAIRIPTLAVWDIDYIQLLKHQRLSIYKISLDNLSFAVCMDETNPASLLPTLPEDTTLEKADDLLKGIEVKHIDIENLRGWLRSTTSPLDVKVDSLSFACHGLGYSFADSLFTYNDSVYSFSFAQAKVATPDGQMALEVHNFAHENQGPLTLGYTHILNTVTPKEMARRAKDYITWIDLELNSLATSPFNPIRKALAKDCTLESIKFDVRRMHVFRDESGKPKLPFPTPQEVLRQLPIVFNINKIDGIARIIDVEYAKTDINIGKLHVKDIRLALHNVTNKPGTVWYNRAKAPIGTGKVDASFNMYMDKASTFELSIAGDSIEMSFMNPFIRPLVGMTCESRINKIDVAYKGDKTKANGTFCMQYSGLDIQVHKEDKIPYKIITDNADLFTGIANALIPKSNPTAVDIHPRKYAVEWVRDLNMPFAFYLFGPCIDGVKMTMLPGLYVHKQVQ